MAVSTMEKHTELLQRVRDDALAITDLVQIGTNVPLEQYVDKPSLNALCDSLSMDPDAWEAEDLERILLIRDGLYELRNRLRDTGDEAEHSVDQLLGAVDRLYADLERVFREINQDQLKKAQTEVAALQRGPHIAVAAVPLTTRDMRKEASEVLVHAHMSIKHIEVNLLKIDRSNVNFEILRNLKLTVQRMSASVFAIKLSLEQTIVYQGIFKLLTDGADKIVDELKKLIQQMRTSYEKATDFISDLSELAEKGTRFARLVAQFLSRAFGDVDRTEETLVKLKVQVTHQSEAVLCAAADANGVVLIAGKSGSAWTADPASGRFTPRYRLKDRAVFSLAYVGRDMVAIGSDDGLEVVGLDSNFPDGIGSYRERVVAIVVPQWGAKGSRGTIVSGSRDGLVRRWTLAGGLSQFSEQSYEQIGRRLQCLEVHGEEIIAASLTELVFVDQDIRTKRTMRVPFEVTGMSVLDTDTLVVCGEGNIAQINLVGGMFTRMITASNTAGYSCVAACDRESFYFGTNKGRLGLMHLASGEELASVDVGFELRGIVLTKNKVLAYGGDWKSRGRSIALVTMDRQTQQIED